ncbi:MAG: DUF262 domain-containing protein [Candidatus Electrothrix sp. LOE1_4_5]|nr:DUF262 domain-containing protein [Candidatus Electrothrix gigas]MCI5226008.1 DUF262 domain-containing protein [Candidatus Electrothrix gigas]
MKLEAEIENIKKILVDDEKFYQVPDYQRPYSWDKDNLSDLIDDLTTAYLENYNETYFCGSLVLVKNEDDQRLDIIDGQQRTTTFTIIACVLRDIYFNELQAKSKDYINNSIQDKYEENKRKLKFLTNEKYQIDFEETVLKKINFIKTRNIEKNFKDNKYLKNAHYIKIFMNEKITENKIDVNKFVEWLYENVVLTVITCPSQDSAIQIFNVLNDRGMPLSSIDILKSSLMQKLDGKEDRNAFKATWEKIDSNLKFVNLDLDGMLTTFLYYKLASNPKSRLDKELLNIFQKEKKGSLSIINEIDKFTTAYIEITSLEDKYIYCLRYLRHKIYWNSILSTALFTEYPQINKLKQLLVAYYYQNWIAGATVARIKQTSFNIIKLIKSKSEISDIQDEMRNNLKRYSTTKIYKEEIEDSWIYGRKWDKAILLLVEYFSSDDAKSNFIPTNNKLHLEHILPQTTTSYWEELFSEEERETWTNSLANLTLLSMRKNIQAQNYSFEDKKKAYQDKDNVVSSFIITQDILKSERWCVDDLEKREEKLLGRISEKLDLF